MGNLRNLSSHASKSASSLVGGGGRRRTDHDAQAAWDKANLSVPQSAHNYGPGSRGSSSSSPRGGGGADASSIDYAFPPGPIATPDPRIGLPYQVQHNVHVDVGPEGYRGLPASWARYLAEQNEGVDEDDPRLQLESRAGFRRDDDGSDDDADLESDAGERMENLTVHEQQQQQHRTSTLSAAVTEATNTANGWDSDETPSRPNHLSSVSTRDDSSGKRTARPSMAPSRASTSYSSVLNRGWDDWSEGGATPPPPVPPLPHSMQTPSNRRMSGVSPMTVPSRYADGRGDADNGDSDADDAAHVREREQAEKLGLGLDLGLEAPSRGRQQRPPQTSPLLPNFLTGGGQEDDDWAMTLLNSIPAAGTDESPGRHAGKDDAATRKMSRHASQASQRSRTKSAENGGASRASQSGGRGFPSPRASTASGKSKPSNHLQAALAPPLPLPSPRASTHAGADTRPSSRASKKSRKSRNPSRAASRLTTRSVKTSGADWSESSDADGSYTGEDESDEAAMISTATTERMGKVTAPRALTHSQFVSQVRSSPGSNNSEGFTSPIASPMVSDRGTPSGSSATISRFPHGGSPRLEMPQNSSGSGGKQRPQVPQLFIDPRLAESAYHKKYGNAVVAALEGESSAETSQPKSAWSAGSESPREADKFQQQPTTPGGSRARGFANFKMGSLAANAKKVAAAATGSAGATHSLFNLKTSAASRSTPTLSKPSRGTEEPMPPSLDSRIAGVKASDANEGGPSTSQASSPIDVSPSLATTHILGLRERRKMNAPARVYPPNASQTGKIRTHNLPDSDSGHVGSSDAGSVANASMGARTESSSSIAPGALRTKGSNSSLTGHLRKGSLRGLFRRESQEQEFLNRNGRPSDGSIGGHSSTSHSLVDAGARGIPARNLSESSAGAEIAPRVPAKDSHNQGAYTTRAPPINFIRPDANGWFTVPPPSARSASNASADAHLGRTPQQQQQQLAVSAQPSPAATASEWGAGDYLEQWMHEDTGSSSAGRSPGGHSAYSDLSASRSTRKPTASNTDTLGLPSPGYADPRQGPLLSPVSATGPDSALSSPASNRDKALPSPGYFDDAEAIASGDTVTDGGRPSTSTRRRSVPELEYLGYSPDATRDRWDAAKASSDSLHNVDDPNASQRSSIASMPDQEVLLPASKQGRRIPSPDHEAIEAANAARPSSRMSTSSKASRRNNRAPRRSTDTRHRFPVSMHYASGFSESFFDVPDGSDMPRESFDLDELMPQHLNGVPPVPPLPAAAANQYSVPASPLSVSRPLPSRGSTHNMPGSKSPKIGGGIPAGGASPAHSRAPSRNSSTRKSPRRRSRSRSRAHLPSGIASSRKFDLNLPDAVKPAARFLSSADPERVFTDLSLIGSGDSGDVYSAVGPGGAASGSTSMSQAPMSDVVAIKVIRIHAPRDSKTEQEQGVSRLESLSSELALWTACKSEHILSLYDVFYAPQHTSQRPGVWISQELADRSLADIVSLKPAGLSIGENHMAKFLSDVLEALAALHAKLIIHRDVRSDNVLICANGMAKLSDFTHAVQLEADGPESKRKSVVGTAYWMAPELIKAQSYDVAVDLWSLGATLYELCEGDPPNVKLPPTRAIQQVAQFGLPPLTNPEGYSTALRDFLKTTTEMRPKKRSTAKALLQKEFVLNCCSNGQIVELMDEARDVEERLADEEEEDDGDGGDDDDEGSMKDAEEGVDE